MLELTYEVKDKARLAGEWSVGKVCLDILGYNIFSAAPELDVFVIDGTKCSVVLFNAVAGTTPVQMHVDH